MTKQKKTPRIFHPHLPGPCLCLHLNSLWFPSLTGLFYLSSLVGTHKHGSVNRERCLHRHTMHGDQWQQHHHPLQTVSCQNITGWCNITSSCREASSLWLCVTAEACFDISFRLSVFHTAIQHVMLIGHMHWKLCCVALVLWCLIMNSMYLVCFWCCDRDT